MSRSDQSRRSRRSTAAPSSYWAIAKRPLQILVFLLPFIMAYEIGLAMVLQSDDGVLSNVAHIRLLRFFEDFGIDAGGGLFLGGIAIVVVLLVWHLLARDPWEVDLKALGLMSLEATVLTLPLIVFGQLVVSKSMPAADSAMIGMPLLSGGDVRIAELDLWSRLAISIGAGLYEELLFRMILLAVIHTLLVDVGRASHHVGAVVAIVVSAAVFTWYHPLDDGAGNLSWSRMAFYFVAGLYFGAVYVARGFGIVVAVHALYDLVMVSMAQPE